MLYASDSLINVMIPFDAAVNTAHQLHIQRGNSISVPVMTAIFSVSPTILSANGSGSGQGHLYVIGAGGVKMLADLVAASYWIE